LIFLIILDGAAESGTRFLNGLSPAEAAHTPCLDNIIRHGVSGNAAFFIPGRDADSLTCILTMLGVPADRIPASRAPLEALGAGIEIEGGGIVWRCNVVSEKGGVLASFNGGGLSKSELRDFSAAAAGLLPPDITLFHLSDYRNLLVMKDGGNHEICDLDTPPPHQNLGLPVSGLLKGISDNRELARFIRESRRIRNGYMLYPWGAGREEKLPCYRQLTGRTAGCVCKTEIMAGIAKAMGMGVCIPAHATGDFDTDLKEKARAALELAGGCDTVVVHINGTDELAHRRDIEGKVRFIEKTDNDLTGRILSETNIDARFIITSDHVTSSETGRHERLPVTWHCADFKVDGRRFVPPPIDANLAGQEQFYKLLQGGKS
jgi:2,3-bisphosphoglycerate-independent phosphoglycerate mutase